MAQTGAEKGCCGDFALGFPGTATDPALQCFADCCNSCPPDCCDTLYFYYECCCEEAEEEASFLPQFPLVDEDTDYYFAGEKLGRLPSFTPDDQPMVRGLDVVGSVVGSCPCESLTITLTTSYCCFVLGGGASATHVGDGTVSASISAGSGYCGDYSAEISVNGGAWQSGAVAVSDNDTVSVRLVVSGDDTCPEEVCDGCECSFIGSEDPCDYGTELFALRTTPTGNRLTVNREAVMRRYHTLRQPQMIQALRERKKADPKKIRRAVRRIAPVKSIKRVPIF